MKNFFKLLLYLLIIVLPYSLYTVLGVSLSVGLAVDAVLLGGLLLLARKLYVPISVSSAHLRIFLLLATSFLLQSFYWIGLDGFDFDKAIFSILLLLTLLLISIFGLSFFSEDLDKSIVFSCSLLLFVSFNILISFMVGPIFSYGSSKSAFLISEPSYVALIIFPFLLFLSLIRDRRVIWFLVFFAAYAILVQNLTLILILCVSSFFYFSGILLRGVFLIVFPVIVFFVLMDDYFLDRLSISNSSENMSVLVLLQGWENARLALSFSSFIGVGFQQFGIVGPIGSISARIDDYGFAGLNLYDGGTLAAKIVGEMGFLGVVLLLLYVILAMRCLVYIFKNIYEPSKVGDYFAIACILSFSAEIFIRGVGYFSPGCFLFFLSLLYLLRWRKL